MYIGSVKTNIGHLEAAAGVAGLIKTLLMMKYETIVPSLWYQQENENPKLQLDSRGFIVPTECINWPLDAAMTRIACVNSFGFGGTNAHAIVEQYIQTTTATIKTEHEERLIDDYIICISATDFTGLKESVRDVQTSMEQRDYNLGALSYTSTCRRDHKFIRKVVRGRTREEIIAACSGYLTTASTPEYSYDEKNVVFVFCGVGTAWNGMCTSLMKFGTFRKAVEDIDKHLKPLSGWTMTEAFLEPSDILSDPCLTHIAIFACQVGLSALWKQFGIEPNFVIGQSVGEVAASYIGGHLDLHEAVTVIFYRSTFLSRCKTGGMAVIRGLDTDLVAENCESIGSVYIAVYNSPTSCTISGDRESIKELKESLVSQHGEGFTMTELNVECAYHTKYVEQAADDLETTLEFTNEREGTVPMISTVSGKKESSEVFTSASYWARNVRNSVLYSDAVRVTGDDSKSTVFLEIGPSPTLQAHIRDILPEAKKYSIFPSMKKQKDIETLIKTINSLYEIGLDINWEALIPHNDEITDIPRYCMNKYKMLYESPSSIMRSQGVVSTGSQHMYVQQLPNKDGESHFRVDIDTSSTRFVFEHDVNGQTIIPGAMYADIGFEIATRVMGCQANECTVSLEFLRPVKLEGNSQTRLHVSTIGQLRGTLFHVKVKKITMCKGFVKLKEEAEKNVKFNVDSLALSITKADCIHRNIHEMYGVLQSLGFSHGPSFRLMNKCITNGTESLTEISVPADILKETNSVTIHPCILDAMMQSTINVTNEELFDRLKKEKLTFLPVALGELSVLNKPEERMYIYTKRINTTILETVFQIHYNACLLNRDGVVIADLHNYTTYSKRNESHAPCELRYKLEWHPHPIKSCQTEEKTKPNILILVNDTEQEILEDVESQPFIAVHKYVTTTNVEDVTKECLETAIGKFNSVQNVDSVVLTIQEQKINDVDSNTAEKLSDTVVTNCLLFLELERRMYEKNMKCPLYVVTQNAQDDPLYTNLLGGELWGLIRSLHIEGSHCPITLIDVQPSLKEAQNELFQLVENTYKDLDGIKPELLIRNGIVLGAQFSKDPKRTIIPELRLEHRQKQKNESSHKVFSTDSQCLRRPFLHVADADPHPRPTLWKNYAHLSVKSVNMHSSEMFPNTLDALLKDQGVCDRSHEARYQLYGIEYIGSTTNSKATAAHEVNVGFEDDYICIFPAEMRTELMVPKDCMVKLSELGDDYTPGLLFYSLLFWRIADKVKKRSSVLICCERPTERMLLIEILKYRKSARIVEADLIKSSAGQRIDVMVSLEKFDPCSSFHRQCNLVICQHDNLPDAARFNLSTSGKTKLDTFDIESMLSRKSVSTCLHNVAKWLRAYLQDLKTRDVPNEMSALHGCHKVNLIEDGQLSFPVRKPVTELFSKSKTYVVTGGLTGLGWEITKIIAEMGAGVIVLMSRRSPTEDQMKDIAAIENSSNCTILHTQVDVTDLRSVLSAFELIQSKYKQPVNGIFHCAGVLIAELITNIGKHTLDTVLGPKVKGIMNMHIASKDMDLDYFLVSSSINSIMGSLGQASYGAANSFVDSFMKWRRNHGFAGQSINWGALEIGMGKEFAKSLTDSGSTLLSVLEVRGCLVEALMRNSTSIIYTDAVWDDVAKEYSKSNMARPKLIFDIQFEQAISFVADTSAATMTFDLEVLKVADRHTRIQAINKVVRFVASKVVGGDMNTLKGSATLSELGFDSMSSVTFVSIVHDITGYRLGVSFMSDTSHTIDDLVIALYDGLFNALAIPNTSKVAPT